MSLIYWVGNTKIDAELVLSKQSILSPLVEFKAKITHDPHEVMSLESQHPLLKILLNLIFLGAQIQK